MLFVLQIEGAVTLKSWAEPNLVVHTLRLPKLKKNCDEPSRFVLLRLSNITTTSVERKVVCNENQLNNENMLFKTRYSK